MNPPDEAQLRCEAAQYSTPPRHTAFSAHHFTALTFSQALEIDLPLIAMGLNLGIPCRHYFQLFTKAQGLTFSIGMIKRRWLQDSIVDVESIPPVTFNHTDERSTKNPSYTVLPLPLQSNPLSQSTYTSRTPHVDDLAPSLTVPARLVDSEIWAALQPLTAGIQTAGDLQGLLGQLQDI
ncbi:hypothetical protein Moror_16116 [Moniliophthora roreri MCA 2997]|uniref:Uncharacterized protein n=1 Tax=Moniliophthora roreri (strain MCA 2997) TaxID=1381753 RepID=V2X6R5_MONRO|nr:hypothetical protein Moror_16116 [Moniliophthora roreri MCA 2997]